MVDTEEEIIEYKNWTIRLNENKIKNALNIYIGKDEDFKYYDASIEQEKLNVNSDFKDKSLKEIKERIVNLLKNENSFKLEYDQEKGFMKLILKLKEDYSIILKENKNQVIHKLFEQMSSLMEKATINFEGPKKGDNINNIESDYKIKVFSDRKVEKKNITCLSTFPNGLHIIGTWNGRIEIYEKDIKHHIFNINLKPCFEKEAHKNCVMYISIFDDNCFSSCSDTEIKIWKKNNENIDFKEDIIIDNAHDDVINKIIFYNNELLFSCSLDSYIKIWDMKIKNQNTIQENYSLKEDNEILSIEIMKRKNNENKDEEILISSGFSGTTIYDIKLENNNKLEKKQNYFFPDAVCYSRFGINILDNNSFIICGNYIYIFSINKDGISCNEEKIKFSAWGSCFVDSEILFVGSSNDIIIFAKNDTGNFEQSISISEFKNKNFLNIVQLENEKFFIFTASDFLNSFDYAKPAENMDDIF
jgi:WD40 repeat protein